MAAQNVCQFNKFGYCKHREHCRNLHVNEVCESSSCDIKSCLQRHPFECKYYNRFRRCKFDPCKFLHIEKMSDIESLKSENKKILDKVDEINEIVNKKDDIEKKLETVEASLNYLNNLEKEMKAKDDMIFSLQQKVVELEEKVETQHKHFEEIVNYDKIEELSDNLKSFERRVYVLERINMGVVFCDQCDSEFPSESEQQTHLRNYHIFECNLCKFRLKNKEELDMHLFTCEIYTCFRCEYRHKRLSEMKTHCNTKHVKQRTAILHFKMDRDDNTKITSTEHMSDEV